MLSRKFFRMITIKVVDNFYGGTYIDFAVGVTGLSMEMGRCTQSPVKVS